MKAVAIIEVDEILYRKYRQLRLSVCSINCSEFLKRDLVDLHLQLFYPGVLDKNKPMMPPAIFYMNLDEELTAADKKGKENKLRVRHPILQ